MTHTMRGALLVLVIASNLSAQEPMTVRWHDLGGAEWRMAEQVRAPRALPLQEAFSIREPRDPEDLSELSEPMVGGDEGRSALRVLLGNELMDGIEVIHHTPGAMLVRAEASVHERLREGIQTLREAFTRRARVSVYRAPLASFASQKHLILSFEEVVTFKKRPELELVATGHLPIGGGSTLKALQLIEVAGDLQVEVANTAGIGQLERRTVSLGFELGLNIHDEHGGGLFVSYAMSDSRLLNRSQRKKTGNAMLITEQGVVTPELPSIELVQTEGLLARGSASVPNGGGVLLSKFEGEYPTAYLICFEAEALKDSLTQGTSRLWPLGRLCANPFSNPVHLPMLCYDREEFSLECGEDATAPLEMYSAADLLGQILDGEEDTETLQLGDHMFVRASAAAHARIETMLKATQDTLSRTIAFDFRYGAVDSPNLNELAALATSLPGRALISAREGDPLAFISGKERTRIARHQVEIAQQSALPAPEVHVHFAGFAFSGHFHAADESTLHGTFTCNLRKEVSQQSYPLSQANTLEIDLSTDSDLRTHGKARWTLGEWNLIRIHRGGGSKSELILVRPMLAP